MPKTQNKLITFFSILEGVGLNFNGLLGRTLQKYSKSFPLFKGEKYKLILKSQSQLIVSKNAIKFFEILEKTTPSIQFLPQNSLGWNKNAYLLTKTVKRYNNAHYFVFVSKIQYFCRNSKSFRSGFQILFINKVLRNVVQRNVVSNNHYACIITVNSIQRRTSNTEKK